MSPSKAEHQVNLLRGSEAFFQALVRAFDASRHEIRLETYIFHPQEEVIQVTQALIRAARRGVRVFLVFDGAGTPALPQTWQFAFDDAGVQWKIFRPIGWLGLLFPRRWRRLHRKLCVVDAEIGFCGGINLLDDRIDLNHGRLEQPRLDYAVQVRGPMVRRMHGTMVQLWWRSQASVELKRADLPGAWSALRQASRKVDSPQERGEIHRALVQLVLRDNLRHRTGIERAYRRTLARATTEVLIANAYFLPGRKMRDSLIQAARRGVRVRLLLQGRYEYFMQLHAARALYDGLLAAGVEIYEYTPSFLHAKVAVVDSHWVTIGSSNIDPLSLLLALEANVVVEDMAFAVLLTAELEQAMEQHASRVDPAAYHQRAWHARWLDQMALLLMRFTLLLIGLRY